MWALSFCFFIFFRKNEQTKLKKRVIFLSFLNKIKKQKKYLKMAKKQLTKLL